MRQIGLIPAVEEAERFQDYLIAQGIKCSLDVEETGYAVWVHNDDQLAAAKTALAEFLANPQDERYRDARKQADALLREQAAQRKAARRNMVAMSQHWSRPASAAAPLTVGLLLICVLVFAQTEYVEPSMARQRVEFGDVEDGLAGRLMISTDGTWRAILEDREWWRLLTPSILHFGIMHIVFNMMWWWRLGGMIELRKGTPAFLGLVIVTALATDLLQFQFAGWRFGGMSGVVYGLIGYAFVKGKLDPSDGIDLDRQSAAMALFFYVICWTGALGPIANFGHAGGLLAGITCGCLSAAWRYRR